MSKTNKRQYVQGATHPKPIKHIFCRYLLRRIAKPVANQEQRAVAVLLGSVREQQVLEKKEVLRRRAKHILCISLA